MNHDELDRLFHAHMEGNLSDADAVQLRQTLHDPEARRRWRDLSDIEGAIADRFASSRQHAVSAFRWPRFWQMAAAAALLLCASSAWLLWARPRDSALARVLYIVKAEMGKVDAPTLRHGGTAMPLAEKMEIRDCDNITAPQGVFVAVQYAGEETMLELAAGASATFSVNNGNKRIELSGGRLTATVAKQPAGKPMVIVTPHACTTVLGTQFELDVEPERSQVQVSAGAVKVQDLKTQETASVSAGQQVAVDNKTQPAVSKFEVPKAEPGGRIIYDLDFAGGLPPNWNMGQWFAQGLPDGDQGAVRAVARTDNCPNRYAVSTHSNPSDAPFFAIQHSTAIHLTFRMERPGWVLIFLTASQIGEFRDNLLYKHNVRNSSWQTVDIPVTAFQPTKLKSAAELLGTDCTRYWLQTIGTKDLGFVLTRIWVTE